MHYALNCTLHIILGGSRVFTMYHVTDVSVDKSLVHPDWTEIQPSVVDDKTFDGELVGLPVASFTTTLYYGDLPTISPYPRDGIEDKLYWRVAIPFEYDKYNIFLMNDHPTQIHLLCLNKDGTDVENILSVALKKRSLTDKHTAKYFPNDQPNDYSITNIFVNVAFIRPMTITGGKKWDTVKRSNHGHGELKMIDEENSINLLQDWGLNKLKSSWYDAIESFNDLEETNN